MTPTWSGRLPPLEPDAWAFLHSLPLDRFLWTYDVRGTTAHVQALADAELLTAAERDELVTALAEIEDDPGLIEDTDEDVHSAIERVLTQRSGDLGRKVHTGRSRNDQVATALRLWLLDALGDLRSSLIALGRALTTRAREHASTLAPGYTHLQRAQTITLGHWLAAHAWALSRDLERVDAARRTASVSPLGAGALATSTFPLDPSATAERLGFAAVFGNSVDAVSARVHVADALYAASMVMTDLSRLAEELVVWSSEEFGFVRFPDGHATGSSMMPQKRNPDIAELARGESGSVVGALVALLHTLKGLPFAYDRDLQADKRYAPAALGVTDRALRALTGVMGEATFNAQRLAQACSDPGLAATDLAEALVIRGVPFRTAHEQVAGMVAAAEAAGTDVRSAIGRDPSALAPLTRDEALALMEPGDAMSRRSMPGGPAPESVGDQVRALTALWDAASSDVPA